MKVLLKNVRIAFCDSLHEPKEYEPGDGKFRHSANALVEPGSDNDKAIREAMKGVAVEMFKAKATQNLKIWENNTQKCCYTSGDIKADKYDGFAGMMVLSAHRAAKQGAPGVYDRTVDPKTGKLRVLTARDGKPYAGSYVNMTVDIWAQGAPNEGVRATLIGVQFVQDGDAFGAGAPPRPEDFDDLSVDEMPAGEEDGDLAA